MDAQDGLQEAADLLLYQVENPSAQTDALRRKAYIARFGSERVDELLYTYRQALIIAEMHQHIANKFLLQAGALEGHAHRVEGGLSVGRS